MNASINARYAFFDFDDTIAKGDSILPYLLFCSRKGIAPRGQLFTALWAYLKMCSSKGTIKSAKEKSLSFIKGKTPEELHTIATQFFQQYRHRFYADALHEINKLKADGWQIIIVSASSSVYMNALAQFLPVDHIICTECEMQDGQFTGKIGANCKKDEKPVRIRAFLAENGLSLDSIESRAYGDSPSDIPMLKSVGTPCLVNPSRSLAKAHSEIPSVHWS